MNWLHQISRDVDNLLPRPVLYPFQMTWREKRLFNKWVAPARGYLEFGSGGSTLQALRCSQATVYSVDSSREWLQYLRQYRFVRQMEEQRLQLYHVDIGPTTTWGRPVGTQSQALFPHYSSWIFTQVDKATLDTVLVDGRFRVACVLRCILECHANADVHILMHDFKRAHYQVVLDFADVVERAGHLVVLRPHRHVDLAAVQASYALYQYDDN